ncbi:polyketide cyclase [Humibacillus sp. DSM 29435]|uniref:SRPBCC family protein n=1 Tax=Humibacillus sp. DSM 29435 TaxID=1869167 RepID=UPI0008722F6B|nr:SRPBCC family protein [Humibacillus sp. DSM 29435]OFE17845.1 polyketide cyclase [Humibacillus sp. DSM 29435]
MEIVRTVTVDRSIDQVWGYLSDFTHTTDWDPGTVRTERTSGDGGVGTRYHNVSKFLGRQTELDYQVDEFTPNEKLALRGENATVVAHDTMTLSGSAERTTVTYRAAFEFKGIAKLVAPLLAPALRRLGDEAEAGLREALTQL